MSSNYVKASAQNHPADNRRAGLRSVQFWVPDTRHPGFAKECRRQSQLVARDDRTDEATQQLLDESLTDITNGS